MSTISMVPLGDDKFGLKVESDAAYQERWRRTQELLNSFTRVWAKGTNPNLRSITSIQKEDGSDDRLFRLMQPFVMTDVCGPNCNLTAYGHGTVEDLLMGQVDGETIVATVRLLSVSEHQVVFSIKCSLQVNKA